jgi:iron-sulfur cluster repair protein YtfE (RIC family)
MQAVPRAGGGPGQAWRCRSGRSSSPLATPDRVAALSEQLIHVHQALREQLTSLRQEAVGDTGPLAAEAALPEDLLSHCLSFCTAIRIHHSGEDNELLPALRAAAPELAPVIDNLIEDHELVAGILRRIRELLARGLPPSGSGALRRELDGLTAILESHFSYEERRLAKALDHLGHQAWTADVFALRAGPLG